MKKYYLLIITAFSLGFGVVNAQYRDLFNFNGANGQYTFGSLTLSGNRFYGVTLWGGANYDGCIFSIDTNGGNYRDLWDFDDTGSNGYSPQSSLIILGSKLYGMTESGGPLGGGIIFLIDTTGSGFKDLWDFGDTAFWTPDYNGEGPTAPLVISGGKFYGITQFGGVNNFGNVFSIDTNGNNYKDLVDFADTNGSQPEDCSVTISGNKLYGMTLQGGMYGDGVIFSADTNGSGFEVLNNFNGPNGENPGGSLTLVGKKLYGVTQYGGANGWGNIVSIDTDGSNFNDLLDFDSARGGSGLCTLIYSQGLLYGAGGGASYNYGCIFSIDTNGNSYTKLYNFDSTSSGALGVGGSLTLSGNVFYGMASLGGTNDSGEVFSFKSCFNIYDQPICVATIDTSNNKAEVIWGRINSPSASGYGYYNIYKDSALGYELTHSQPLDSLSEYMDLLSDPSADPVSYELSTVDSCGESALSAPHTTIYLTTTLGINAFILNWTAYVGFTPSKYRIFRGPALNAMVQIDSVPSSVLTYTDSFPPLGSYYGVEAVSPFGVCTPTTHRPNTHSSLLSGSFSNGFNTATLGVKNLGSNVSKLNIYPNPNNGIFTVSYSLNNGDKVRISIVNELGEIVYNKTEQRNSGNATEQLNLENIAAGIYSLRVQTDNGIIVRKLAVVKK